MMFSSVEECCQERLGWIQSDVCTDLSTSGGGSGDGSGATGKWYVDSPSGSCVKDCPASSEPGCGGPVPPPIELYDSAETCCSTGQSWVNLDYCSSRSIGNYTGLWVVDYDSETCAQDCDPELGSSCKSTPHNDHSAMMFSSAEECCRERLGWILIDVCTSQSKIETGDSTAESNPTNLYYIDWAEGRCLKDCPPDQEFGCEPVPPPIALYDSIGQCCDAAGDSVNDEFCATRSVGGYTYGWVVDYTEITHKCSQDCNPALGRPCFDHNDPFQTIYSSVQECCAVLSYVPNCATIST